MTGFSTWQIVLSIAVPVGIAVLIYTLEARGPLAPALKKTTGIVPPYFSAIAIVFGLFTALLMSDVWQKDNAARQSVQAEDDAIRGLLHLARVTSVEAAIVPRIKDYVAAATKENPYSRADSAARANTDRAYEALLRAVSQTANLDYIGRSATLAVCAELRHARDKRLFLADDQTPTIKWLSILVLGTLTQIAILLVYIGNRRAMRVSVGLFTVAYSFCVVIFAVFDAPFEIALSHEPGATLAYTMRGL